METVRRICCKQFSHLTSLFYSTFFTTKNALFQNEITRSFVVASLKGKGDCLPDLQRWRNPLSRAESGAVAMHFVHRVPQLENAPQQIKCRIGTLPCARQDIEFCNAATGKNVRVAHCPHLSQANLNYPPILSVSSSSPCVNVGNTGATRGQAQCLITRCDHSCSKDWRLNTWLPCGPKISCRSGSKGERFGEGVDGGQLGL
jgi:hypothetical protein